MAARTREVLALQDVLAGEHATVYGYGVAGARLSGTDRARAQRAFTAHRAQRDRLEGLIRARDGQPVTAATTYALPAEVRTAPQAVALAALLEQRLAAVYADGVAELDGDLRMVAVDGLRDAAVAAAGWTGRSVAFPGLPERST